MLSCIRTALFYGFVLTLTFFTGVGLISCEFIRNTDPIATFTMSDNNPAENEWVEFDASTSRAEEGDIVRYDWDFGDGETGSGMIVTHSYDIAGTYTVVLKVTDAGGLTDEVEEDISVLPEQENPTDDMYTVRMAESIMGRNPSSYGSWNYETGTVLRGFEELYKVSGDERFFNYVKNTVDAAINSNGTISYYTMSEYNLDQIKEGSLALYLYEETGDERYRIAADTLNRQLANHPTTREGGYWHKNKYPYQMWLDGLYMAEPFNAHYGAMFDQPGHFDDVVLQLTLMETHARDSVTGLLYHGWDESGRASWADAQGRSPIFWGRALGWYAMALVDVLDFIPEQNSEQRSIVIAILNRLAVAISRVQEPDTGVWWQVIDRAGDNGNWRESSSSAMFVYALAKGVRKGYLDESFSSVAQKGWKGILNTFLTEDRRGNLNLTGTCEGTGVGGSYAFYIGRNALNNDPKGLGPFLLAGVEIELLVK